MHVKMPFILDKVVIIPIAVAGGIALLIFLSLYCWQRCVVQGKRLFRPTSRPRVLENVHREDSSGAGRMVRTIGRGIYDCLAAVESRLLPSVVEQNITCQRRENTELSNALTQRDPFTHDTDGRSHNEVSTLNILASQRGCGYS